MFYLSIFILVTMHGVGIYGLTHEDLQWRESILRLSPVNLMLTAFLLLINFTSQRGRILLLFFIVAIIGFSVEVIGVSTGFPFGNYSYGANLGLKIQEVPLVIGLNWAVLVFSIGAALNKIYHSVLIKSAIGASLMTLFDFLLEPIAVRSDYWKWESMSIPIQNYISWFAISFFLFLLVYRFVTTIDNKIGIWVFLIQFVFFSCLHLLS